MPTSVCPRIQFAPYRNDSRSCQIFIRSIYYGCVMANHSNTLEDQTTDTDLRAIQCNQCEGKFSLRELLVHKRTFHRVTKTPYSGDERSMTGSGLNQQ